MPKNHTGGRGIILNITEEIINLAIPRDSSHCIVADALRAAVPQARFVAVDLQTIRWTEPTTGRRYIYLTPAPLQRLLVDFDQGIMPEPFRARLGRPAQITRSNVGRANITPSTQDLPPGSKAVVAKPDIRNHTVPTVLGGKPPPTAALSSTRGRRRAFGLRSLGR